jgi:hypothetical protein
VTYEEVMGEISRCIPLEHIAQEAGVTETAIERTQLDRSDKSYIPPPPNWRQVIARLAWERSGVLIALARELDEVHETTLVTFQEAMNQVVPCVSPEYVAREAGVTEPEMRQVQEGYRSPPPHWRKVIARLAWERGGVLQSLAREREEQAGA